MLMTPNEYIRKLQRKDSMADERDLGEEAEDEILESTGKTDLKSKQYKKLLKILAVNKRRNEIPTMDCTPLEEEENPEEFMESVYKKELGSNFEVVDSGVAVGFYDSLPETSSSENKSRWYPERELIDFTEDSEYKRLLKIQARARGEKD